jgi:hypothetical protein
MNSEFPEFQHKPQKTPNYKEKVKLGLISGGLKRTKGLNPISKKHKKELDKYIRMCYNDAELQKCFRCGLEANKDILQRHHTHGRSGDNLYKYEYCCVKCHEWIHANPNKARELKLLFF